MFWRIGKKIVNKSLDVANMEVEKKPRNVFVRGRNAAIIGSRWGWIGVMVLSFVAGWIGHWLFTIFNWILGL